MHPCYGIFTSFKKILKVNQTKNVLPSYNKTTYLTESTKIFPQNDKLNANLTEMFLKHTDNAPLRSYYRYVLKNKLAEINTYITLL